ncbi:MAG TPA: rubrerythrin family protein [Candidatus Moranbacteria bacterium]|nr:rubrerythrin family protein [Candidatus Moranbacteria bacterium]
MKTKENLLAAFAGESQANRKYLAFAKAAEKEGKNGLAKLFRVAAEGETLHALKHLENAGEIKGFEDNLREAIAGETHEFTHMYPEFLAKAKEEGESVAMQGFHFANEVEKIHEKLFAEALAAKGDLEETEYYICSVCGYPHKKESPERCPICGAPREKFYLFS